MFGLCRCGAPIGWPNLRMEQEVRSNASCVVAGRLTTRLVPFVRGHNLHLFHVLFGFQGFLFHHGSGISGSVWRCLWCHPERKRENRRRVGVSEREKERKKETMAHRPFYIRCLLCGAFVLPVLFELRRALRSTGTLQNPTRTTTTISSRGKDNDSPSSSDNRHRPAEYVVDTPPQDAIHLRKYTSHKKKKGHDDNDNEERNHIILTNYASHPDPKSNVAETKLVRRESSSSAEPYADESVSVNDGAAENLGIAGMYYGIQMDPIVHVEQHLWKKQMWRSRPRRHHHNATAIINTTSSRRKPPSLTGNDPDTSRSAARSLSSVASAAAQQRDQTSVSPLLEQSIQEHSDSTLPKPKPQQMTWSHQQSQTTLENEERTQLTVKNSASRRGRTLQAYPSLYNSGYYPLYRPPYYSYYYPPYQPIQQMNVFYRYTPPPPPSFKSKKGMSAKDLKGSYYYGSKSKKGSNQGFLSYDYHWIYNGGKGKGRGKGKGNGFLPCLPTPRPVIKPTEMPTNKPTFIPTISPKPTPVPSPKPTKIPTFQPTARPTRVPTNMPSKQPTNKPTSSPTSVPTQNPTQSPTFAPTSIPTSPPTPLPTTTQPTPLPTTARPTFPPTPLQVLTEQPTPQRGTSPVATFQPTFPIPPQGPAATPQPSAFFGTPAPSPGGQTPAPTVFGFTPAPTGGGFTPAPTATGFTPAPTVGGLTTPSPTAGQTTPAPTATAVVTGVPTFPAIATPAPTVATVVTPAPTVAPTPLVRQAAPVSST